MTTATMNENRNRAPCSVCYIDQDLPSLINLSGYPICRNCLENASRSIGPPRKRIYKIRDGKQVAGICGGLADYANFDRDTFRVFFIVAAVVTGFIPLLICYIILAFVLPSEP